MGIVKMKRLTLVGLLREKNEVLSALAKLGAIDVRLDEEARQEWVAAAHEEENRSLSLQRDVDLLEAVIPRAKDLLPFKNPMFTLKRSLSMKEFLAYADPNYQKEILSWAERFQENRREYQETEARLASYQLQLDVLTPWAKVLGEARLASSSRIQRIAGKVADQKLFQQLREQVEAQEQPMSLALLQAGETEKDPVYALLLTLPSLEEEALQFARQGGFRPLNWDLRKGEPQEAQEKLHAKRQRSQEKLNKLQAEARKLAHHIKAYEELSDYLRVEMEKAEVGQKLLLSGRLFALQGYIPEYLVKGTQKGLQERFTVEMQLEEVTKTEDYPILLHNNRLARPYEAVTDMFSLPQASEVDPTPVMAPFYCIFFGMMFSDAAYGILFCILTGLLVWKVKVQGNFRKMCQLFFQCGLSSIVWGVLFGGFFGNLLDAFSGGKVVFPTLWFNPMDDPVRMMTWSIVFGALHIFVAMGVKIHILVATGKTGEAILDVVPWYLIIGGLGLIGAGYGFGKYVSIAGAAVVLLFAGRSSKNPIVRILRGLGSLYDITGYFSDVMSYTRILALCLSTSVIAMVVNLLATLPGKSIIGLLLFLIIAVLGHTMNIALSVLSAYVHTTRLHYVEFFSKFFEGGGRAFQPFGYHTKYVLLDQPEEPEPRTESLRERFVHLRSTQESS